VGEDVVERGWPEGGCRRMKGARMKGKGKGKGKKRKK
jgi:hypothetical protein